MSAVVPRNFKLLDELEEAEKGSKGGADISLGLVNAEDTFMTDWQATIFAQAGGAGEARLWFLKLTADKDYPMKPPTMKFTSKITMDCVEASTGNVLAAKVPSLANWNASKTMVSVLVELKGLIQRAPRSQPADGTTF